MPGSSLFTEPGPRVFAMPPGADFPALLVQGLCERMRGAPPEAMARVTLYLNTERMRRRVVALFQARGAMLLPRLRLVTDLGRELALPGLPPAPPALRRKLELARLIEALIDRDPTVAPKTALFDLADSLATLLDEMRGEGVQPEVIAGLDISDHSAHWARTKAFMSIVAPLFATGAPPDAEGRQRLAVERQMRDWHAAPPADPVIVAGSTGSRGTTLGLMLAVAGLPQGALVLPGFDFWMSARDFADLDDPLTGEDHPQFRFHRVLSALDLGHDAVRNWGGDGAPAPLRNRLISLALRPAPVTDRWIAEGPGLGDLGMATEGMALIEAPSPRAEAQAIALILREVAEGEGVAALITPDRTLARQVTVALDRWGLRPDDSAGRPLALSAPGRLLRQVVGLFTGTLGADGLVALLKHPLVAAGEGRGAHLLQARELELHLRRRGPAYPSGADVADWAKERAPAWGAWVRRLLADLPGPAGEAPLAEHVARHWALAQGLASGPDGLGTALWQGEAGEKALKVMQSLSDEAPHAGPMTAFDYASLLDSLLNAEDVRETVESHPRLMIWGTLEARVQGADLLILGGLNEGVWPAPPPPDPWLNRRMRLDAGLLLPERRIGLSAHDFQQAVAARKVVLSRAVRDDEAQTVPARWLDRMVNLMEGLPDQGGKAALEAMRMRGARWLRWGAAMGRASPVATEPRPSPRPAPDHRPRELSVTQVATLIRDPYAIYAQTILRLRPLDPLRASPDARLRGSVLHKVLEQFVIERSRAEAGDEAGRLLAVARRVLAQEVPWPAARALWFARISRAADFFLALEARLGGRPVVIEQKWGVEVPGLAFRLVARPDRIDLLPDGRAQVFDYKTGTPPGKKQQAQFDKQLLLTAALVEAGAFPELGPREVASITYVGLGTTPKDETTVMDGDQIAEVWASFGKLVARYAQEDQGYTARRALFSDRLAQDYDHLSRYGEWDTTDAAVPVPVQ